MPLFGLIDCNNFFVSCERLFNPHLQNHPVIVLSNNDGCIVSRSNEAKALGIPMGSPLFKVKDIVDRANVKCFSSNFTLYGNISKRVMCLIKEHFQDIEVYSVDEAFILFKDLDPISAEKKSRTIIQLIKRATGIPTCIGIAPSKTLAKLANHQAKRNPSLQNAFTMTTPQAINSILKTTPVEDIWGIGRRRSQLLHAYGIHTGLDLINQDKSWILRKLTVLGLRLVQELEGKSLLKLDESIEPRKSILSSRSFSQPVYEIEALQESITAHTLSTTDTLRKEGSMASRITIFIRTSVHTKKTFYSQSHNILLDHPSDFTPDFLKAAHHALEIIYKPGIAYAKAGVILQNLTPRTNTTRPLHLSPSKDTQRHILMNTFDLIRNKFGRNSLTLSFQPQTNLWQGNKNHSSKAYTTKWSDIPIAKA